MSRQDGDRTDGRTGDEAELIAFPGRIADRERPPTEHLGSNRGLIVRRSLLATAVGGLVPIPVMDEDLAGRVRAGMLMQIAERRRVDLAVSSAELLADPQEGTAIRNATLTAATLVALKLAWRKFFALLAVGRRAEEMTTTFQLGTVFDHYCAKMHVGAGLDREGAMRLRGLIYGAISASERAALVSAFRDGGRVLGRSLLEAPGWVSSRLQQAVERYVQSGGNPAAAPPEAAMPGAEDDAEARWLDKAASLVDDRLSRLGTGYLERLLASFERAFQEERERAAKAAEAAAKRGDAGSEPGSPP
jgi:hypothetical protein